MDEKYRLLLDNIREKLFKGEIKMRSTAEFNTLAKKYMDSIFKVDSFYELEDNTVHIFEIKHLYCTEKSQCRGK